MGGNVQPRLAPFEYFLQPCRSRRFVPSFVSLTYRIRGTRFAASLKSDFESDVSGRPARALGKNSILQQHLRIHALGVVEDGVVGPQTLAAAHAADNHVTIDKMCDERMHFLKGLSTWPTYGKGWSNRVADVRATAHGMVTVAPPLPEPVPPAIVSAPAPIQIRLTIGIEVAGAPADAVTITLVGPPGG